MFFFVCFVRFFSCGVSGELTTSVTSQLAASSGRRCPSLCLQRYGKNQQKWPRRMVMPWVRSLRSTRSSHRKISVTKVEFFFCKIQDAGPTSNSQHLGGLVPVGQEINHLDESNRCKKPGPRVVFLGLTSTDSMTGPLDSAKLKRPGTQRKGRWQPRRLKHDPRICTATAANSTLQ